MWCSGVLRFKDMHSPHNILPTDGALVHPFATFGAGDHVATLQKNAVNDSVHANSAEVVIIDC